MLPDLALLEMFYFFINEPWTGAWPTLVHVCKKWRSLVFGSPRRLDLRLYCRVSSPVREMLDIWPPLPLAISVYNPKKWVEDNIIAALEHNDRICHFLLSYIPSSEFPKLAAAMQKLFPALTRLELELSGRDETVPVVPASFLGGSLPRLQRLFLQCIPFPGLPSLLLSATHLVHLRLTGIPHSGYFSPEAMAGCLSLLTRLEILTIRFQFTENRPDRESRSPDLQAPILLPVLAEFDFNGASEYLEVLVARVDAPLLEKLGVIFFHEQIFDTPQLSRFIGRTPKFNSSDEAYMVFFNSQVLISLSESFDGELYLGILCSQSDLQLSSMAQAYRSSFPQSLISAVERLYILEDVLSRPIWQDDIESHQWLELLHPFTTVKDLYISREFVPRIAPALQLAEERTTALPALQSLFLEETLHSELIEEAIQKFVDARQCASHPINVSRWEGKKTMWDETDDE